MKKIIIKILAAFVFTLSLLLSLTQVKTYAASSQYNIAPYITFSSDMDIDKGFELIKPYILYRNDSACFESYEFDYENLDDNHYRYSGTYPDGTTFSLQASIRIINDPSGTYVEAMNSKATRQSIVVTNLRSGKTTSDCLSECWKNRFVNIEYPSYTVETGSTPGGNIYNNLTSYTNGAGEVKQLQYYAIYDVSSYVAPDNSNNEEVINIDNPEPNPTNNEEIDIPDNKEDTPTNTTPDSNIESNNNQESQSNKIKEANPLTIVLICIGAVIGIILIYEIYKLIRLLIRWLKR